MNKTTGINHLKRTSVWLAGSFVLLAAAFTLFISGCTGSPGASGQAGPPGGGDFASVSVTTFAISATQWQGNGAPVTSYSYSLSFDSIADSKNVVVNVYFNDSVNHPTPITWTAMPYSRLGLYSDSINYFPSPKQNMDTVDELSYSWRQGSLKIIYSFLNIPICIQPKRSVYFYATAIPIAVIKRHPEINWNNPAAVRAIPEVQAAFNRTKQ